jgi:hypothetical protein
MRAALIVLAVALVAGCGAKPVHVAADAPPSPATWKRYPASLPASCWSRPVGDGVMRAAPTVLGAPTHTPPRELVREARARLGDRRYVTGAALGPVPPIALRHVKGYFGGERPPRNALWLYVSVAGTSDLATWEASLFGDGLRDAFCTAGGPPLAGFTTGRGELHLFDRIDAVAQRFPSPSPAAFRSRVASIGKRYGFHVASLRLLHAPQLAPLLTVETTRSRKKFVADVPAIMKLLDPQSSAGRDTALTFEGFFFEARDAKGRFVDVFDVHRGEVTGGQWSADRCDYPYPTGGGPSLTSSCPSS